MRASICIPAATVLGHEGCGAIKAALKTRREGSLTIRIQLLVDGLLPGLSEVSPDRDPEAETAQAVEANVRWVVRQILESPEGQARWEEGRMKIARAIYELATGRSAFLTKGGAGGFACRARSICDPIGAPSVVALSPNQSPERRGVEPQSEPRP